MKKSGIILFVLLLFASVVQSQQTETRHALCFPDREQAGKLAKLAWKKAIWLELAFKDNDRAFHLGPSFEGEISAL